MGGWHIPCTAQRGRHPESLDLQLGQLGLQLSEKLGLWDGHEITALVLLRGADGDGAIVRSLWKEVRGIGR